MVHLHGREMGDALVRSTFALMAIASTAVAAGGTWNRPSRTLSGVIQSDIVARLQPLDRSLRLKRSRERRRLRIF